MEAPLGMLFLPRSDLMVGVFALQDLMGQASKAVWQPEPREKKENGSTLGELSQGFQADF